MVLLSEIHIKESATQTLLYLVLWAKFHSSRIRNARYKVNWLRLTELKQRSVYIQPCKTYKIASPFIQTFSAQGASIHGSNNVHSNIKFQFPSVSNDVRCLLK